MQAGAVEGCYITTLQLASCWRGGGRCLLYLDTGEGDVGEEDGRGGRSLLYLGPEEGGSLYLGVEVEEGGAFCILRVGGRRIMTSKLSMQAYNLQSIDNSQFPSLHSASLQFPISNLRCSSRPLHNSFASWWVGGREMFVPWRGRRLILASSRR